MQDGLLSQMLSLGDALLPEKTPAGNIPGSQNEALAFLFTDTAF
jgi:hypothetical protein